MEIPHNQWATYGCDVHRFGHVTSNLSEIENSFLKQMRELPFLHMLDALYREQMEKFYKRAQSVIGWVAPFVPLAIKRFGEESNAAKMYTVFPAEQTCGTVVGGSNHQYVINLPTPDRSIGHCTCGRYQNLLMPCRYVCAFALKVKVAPITLVDKFFTVDTYRATYNRPYVPVFNVNLLLSPLLPPKVSRPRERPVKRRKERGSQKKEMNRKTCKTCGHLGHNRRACREAHM